MGRVAVCCVVGTRPEAVKMAPVILRLRREGSGFDVRVLTTGQHRDLLDRALADFGIAPDFDLDLMRPSQDLADLMARALVALSDALGRERPDLVLAQGDTTTVLAAALACYYHRIPFGHIEAGLRTGRPYAPFPEEKNRALAGHLAELHFAPTLASRRNLLREGISAAAIHVTGNTVLDALLMTACRDVPLPVRPATDRFLLVTAHRRENFGAPLEEICDALLDLIRRRDDLSIIYPVHPNPRVRATVAARLGGRDRIHLIDPTGYPEFVALMRRSFLILTDSGGVQEEAPALGKPVLVLRDATERPEAVAAGTARLVGPRRGAIVAAVEELCERPESYARFTQAVSPYGDGWASERIARILADRFGLDPGPLPVGMSPTWPPRG
ncbi:MAG: UDP-N-acetylglucosamine 2-epimerase (non-hydrolyzing) [Isosphaeraceae bacterium]|nr:UDP-N-acetylglucosamine 2-epimerase (non-hydrolyzing) [Isosphaeraceae bacterium]